MNAAEAMTDVREALLELPDVDGIQVYLFGSAGSRVASASDIDLLVIYGSSREPREVRRILENLKLPLPADIMFLTFEEAEEYQFLASVAAVRVFPEDEMVWPHLAGG